MSRTFSLSTIIRQTPNDLLKEFFIRTTGGRLGVDWDALKKNDVQLVLEKVSRLSRLKLDRVEAGLHAVFDMACDTGTAAIIDTCTASGAGNLAAVLPDGCGPYAAAMWTWLHRPTVFRDATLWHYAESVTKWRRRTDLPAAMPDTSKTARDRLAKDVSHLLVTFQSRGRKCTIDAISRGHRHYFCAYPDDYPRTDLEHDGNGALVSRTHRPTFQVVFAYDASVGALELYAKVPPQVKTRLEGAFAEVVLGHELGPWQPAASYRLDHLMDRAFPLATEPADRLTASIRKMQIRPRGTKRGIRLVGDPDQGPGDVYDMMDAYLNHSAVHPAAFEVTSVTFHFEAEGEEDKRAWTMTFDVTIPNTCSLRNQPEARVELVEKYLRRWQVLVEADPEASRSRAA